VEVGKDALIAAIELQRQAQEQHIALKGAWLQGCLQALPGRGLGRTADVGRWGQRLGYELGELLLRDIEAAQIVLGLWGSRQLRRADLDGAVESLQRRNDLDPASVLDDTPLQGEHPAPFWPPERPQTELS